MDPGSRRLDPFDLSTLKCAMDPEKAKPEEITVEENNKTVIQSSMAEQKDVKNVNNGTITPSSSSSIGPVDDSINPTEESEEIESRNRQLLEAHPLKRKGISRYYDWGSKPFYNLSDALKCESIQEIAKEETQVIRKRKRIRMLRAMEANAVGNNPDPHDNEEDG